MNNVGLIFFSITYKHFGKALAQEMTPPLLRFDMAVSIIDRGTFYFGFIIISCVANLQSS